MKVACLLSSVSRANGGISESVRRLAQSLAQDSGACVSVLGLQDEHTSADAPAWAPLAPRCFPVRGPRAFGYAPALADALAEAGAEVLHTAGLWMYPSVAGLAWSRRTGRPLVISPHGMLDPWALRNSAWKKRLASALFERRHLEQAACFHALCASEADSIRALGLTQPIAVLPNGVDLQAQESLLPPPWAGRIPADRRVLLFLGRLHPKKGLRPLLEAWSQAPRDGWHLVVAGWDQGGHQRELEERVAALNLGDAVLFTGPLHGQAKSAAYAAAGAFILPSHSEGLPMTILEAWAHGTPVLMTAACNLPEGFAAGAAIEITPDPGALAAAWARFAALPDAERRALGERGRALAARSFSWGRIAAEMTKVYRWVAKRGERPDCVR